MVPFILFKSSKKSLESSLISIDEKLSVAEFEFYVPLLPPRKIEISFGM